MIPFINVLNIKKHSKSSVEESWLKGFNTVIHNFLIFTVTEKCSQLIAKWYVVRNGVDSMISFLSIYIKFFKSLQGMTLHVKSSYPWMWFFLFYTLFLFICILFFCNEQVCLVSFFVYHIDNDKASYRIIYKICFQ